MTQGMDRTNFDGACLIPLPKFWYKENAVGNQYDPEANKEYKNVLANRDEAWLEDLKVDNLKHGLEQMLFSWGLICRMKNLLGGESRAVYWFSRNYVGNPNLERAMTEIAKIGFAPGKPIVEKVNQETGEVTAEQAGF